MKSTTPIFTTAQRQQLREIKASLKVLGALDRQQPDIAHWQAAATAARAALDLIEMAIPYLNVDSVPAPDLDATYEEVEIELDEGEAAIIDIVQALHRQIVAIVESLEALVRE